MISISFAYTINTGELFVKDLNVTSFDDALHKIAEYIKPNIHRLVRYECDAEKALWGRDSTFKQGLQVIIHDMMNKHKEHI